MNLKYTLIQDIIRVFRLAREFGAVSHGAALYFPQRVALR